MQRTLKRKRFNTSYWLKQARKGEHVPDLCWGCCYYRCSGHKAVLVTTFDSTDYIFQWHPQQICVFALEVRWLRNLSTSAPYKTENHSGKRRRRAEGRLGNNWAQWVTARHSLPVMRNPLMTMCRRTRDSTLRSSRGNKPAECNKAISYWRKRSSLSSWTKQECQDRFGFSYTSHFIH